MNDNGQNEFNTINMMFKNNISCLPERKTKYSAGFDIYAKLDDMPNNEVRIFPRERKLIPTGMYLDIPDGYWLEVRSRSGLALKYGITAFHGTIDADYHDELGVLLFNNSNDLYTVKHGDRIAQVILHKIEKILWRNTDEKEFEILTKHTDRGGGFGSTGT